MRCIFTLPGRSVRRLRTRSAHWCSERHAQIAGGDLTGNKEPPPCDQELQTAGGGDSPAQKHQRRKPASSQGHSRLPKVGTGLACWRSRAPGTGK